MNIKIWYYKLAVKKKKEKEKEKKVIIKGKQILILINYKKYFYF